MRRFHLRPLVSPLGGGDPLFEKFSGLEIQEIADRSLVSIAAKRDGESMLRQVVQESFGVDLPQPGRITAGPRVLFAWMGQNHWFVDAATDKVANLEVELGRTLGKNASVSDQSDAWVRLRLSGPKVYPVLEKLCMLDLHNNSFPPKTVARTVMGHLGTVISRPEPRDMFELWSARSSAHSFLASIRLAAISHQGEVG